MRRSLTTCLTGTVLTLLALTTDPAAAGSARNIILFISDGASWGTWDMASYWEYGERGKQPYDSFPVKLGMTTYPLNISTTPTYNATPRVSYDPAKAWNKNPNTGSYGGTAIHFDGYYYIKQDYTDSAAAGTALATGTKTFNNAIDYDNFARPLGYITQIAREHGKATGVVSSVPFTHATPATFGAQNINRNNYGEIGKFMVDGDHLTLIMGGGNPLYDSDGKFRSTPRYAAETGPGGGYVAESTWTALQDGTAGGAMPWQFITSKADFEALAEGKLTLTTERVIGVPEVYDTLQANRSASVFGPDAANPSGDAYNPNVPSLVTMTKGALNVLGQDPDGLFVMIEGGAVDWMAHANNTGRIIEEQIDFNKSVAAAIEWVESNSDWDETLMIVLTDHGNGMPMGPNSDTMAFEPIQNNGAGVLPGVKWHYGTHTNENTLLFAIGSGSEAFYERIVGIDPGLPEFLGFDAPCTFRGVAAEGCYVDNTDVFHVMQAATVAEPASLALLGFGSLLVFARARRLAA